MAATPPTSESLARARSYGNNPARCGLELSKQIVLGLREGRTVRPDLALKYGSYLLKQHASALSHEVWAIYEQVLVALLQFGRYGTRKGAANAADSDEMRQATDHMATLATQFPESLRVKRLEGMMWEAKGEADLAMGEYEEILEADPMNLLAIKRQVALCRSRGGAARLGEAARKLCDYLATFCSDPEAWLMLHEIYLLVGQYKRAAFCIEELILINPMAYIYHIRAGEVTYTMGIANNGG